MVDVGCLHPGAVSSPAGAADRVSPLAPTRSAHQHLPARSRNLRARPSPFPPRRPSIPPLVPSTTARRTQAYTTGSAPIMTPPPPAQRFLPLLVVLFVGSGAAALIYEIVWLQLLSLIVGSSAVSMGVLLGTFMGGMGIGSLFLSKYVSRTQHPLRVYAMLEGAIAVFGLLVLWVMPY